MSKGPRNINILDIARYRFPISAITSILHRISGILIFLLLPFTLWLLHASLVSPQSFLLVKDFMGSYWVCFGVWLMASSAFYHLVAGIKHLIMDMGHLEERRSGPIASFIVLVVGIIGAILIGVWILC